MDYEGFSKQFTSKNQERYMQILHIFFIHSVNIVFITPNILKTEQVPFQIAHI